MTTAEKIAQISGYWVDRGDEIVAPMQGEMADSEAYTVATEHGIGHLTRVYGTRPVDPVRRAEWLWAEQRRLKQETRLGIPALVHEECLTGLAAWKAATYPAPPSWGASFDDALVERMAGAIGRTMRDLGIHQGLAPVLDVVRDARWGRVEECISEDPYLVGTVGSAYVRGLQSAGVVATLKHFVGYSGSQAGRNHAPVHAGPRELNDVFLVPFEMALLDGGARSVMNSYAEIDGVATASNRALLTDLLRGTWGFTGTVVADYFSMAFLHTMHQVAASKAEAARIALRAGIDIELPAADVLLDVEEPDAELAELLDIAVARALAQKEELGLLDEQFEAAPTELDLDDSEAHEIALALATESVVLLRNDGALPLPAPATIAVVGPNASGHEALMGCYSFANHVMAHHPEVPLGIEAPDLVTSITGQFAGAHVLHARGCEVEGDDLSGLDEAAAVATEADVVIVAVGDRAGLFGRGTVGEGNDAESLDLPGRQRALVERLVATGTPVVMVVLSGRPYDLSWALDGPDAPAAVLQSFFPGEEGATAIAQIIAGERSPSGRLPLSLPRSAGAQPYGYLHPPLGGSTDITSADSTPVRPFGFGLGYTTFAHEDLTLDSDASTVDGVRATVRVRNTGDRAGTDVVQLYAHLPYRSTTRPVAQLVGYARVDLAAGHEATVAFDVPAARFAGSDVRAVRAVEPGPLELWVGAHCSDKETVATTVLGGPVHEPTTSARRVTVAEVRAS
ncbi:glycoside hydrolase family 3 N-terminal domain-containing protein [Demequina capsici]|uniref:Glycoside hydrolase family 3 N-terminal domain-containing protein n=1 Tax=Demequina capsici TaxID=3075620 RepID=A0AA96JBR3_9MICO|nr:glycoside hydrolase family 3 N-terminal domain-containing protein [Demequina sp. OYTSA14]WNM25996.1 glycoside hydrolase family 3 N-terminal domain-containing protein [Demequina sp. OYTSA14]